MNIPYDKFYEAEGISGVDAVSSSTVKTYNQTMAGGSYHTGRLDASDGSLDSKDGAKILGVTYPVYVEDVSVLKGKTEVTDASAATITVAAGKSDLTTKEVTGADVLFASGDYAYYKMSGKPASYKTLTVKDGVFSFSAVKAEAKKAQFTSAELTYGGHYTNIAFTVQDEANINGTVNAITVTADGTKYALRHVEDIWRLTSLGWNWDSLDGNGLAGKTITNVTYYVKNGEGYGVYSYDVNVPVKKNPGTKASASFKAEKTIAVTGLPADIEKPVAKVASKVGRGETAVVLSEKVEVKDGVITTGEAATDETTYNITISSDNYGDVTVEAVYSKAQIAAEEAAAKEAFKNTVVTLAKKSVVYTGKVIKPAVTVKSGNTVLKKGTDYTVAYKNNKNVGTATVTITGKGSYIGTKTATFKITKAANTLTIKAKKATVKYATVKKKAQTLAVSKVITFTKKGQGTKTYKKVSGNKNITVNTKTGKITVKKGTKKGTYKVKVKVTAKGDTNHKSASKTITVTVVVK